MASEVGSAQVSITPTLKGFRKAVASEVDSSARESTSLFSKVFGKSSSLIGKSAGSGFKEAFTAASKGALDNALRDANSEYVSASKLLSSSRLKEQDATGKVRVAEVALAQARSKTGAESVRSVAAEERLASASRNLGAAQDSVRNASTRLITAKTSLTSATKASEEAANGSSRGFRNLFSTLSNSGGFQAVLGGATSLASYLGRGFLSVLSTVASAFTSVLKVGVGAFVGIASAIGGIAITGGITRLLDIENAQAKLRGLGNTTEDVAQIMQDALASVKGTSFGLGEAATVAASAVAAGIKPGQQLEKYLKLTADAATIAGVSLSEMGSIINKTTTSGKVFTDNLNELADRGIPIFQWLQEEYGVTADELSDMVSRGEVDAATFQKVIEQNIGGAALSAGDTTQGAFANMRAALSRFGAALVGESLPQFKDFFNKVSGFFDSLGGQATEWGSKVSSATSVALGGLGKVLDVIKSISDSEAGFSFENIKKQFTDAFPGLGGVFQVLEALAPILPALANAFKELAPVLSDAIPKLADLLVDVLPQLVPLISSLLSVISENAGGIGTVIGFIISGLGFVAGAFQIITDAILGNDVQIEGLLGTYGPVWDGITGIITDAVGAITGLVHGIEDVINGLKDNIFNFALSWAATFARVVAVVQLSGNLVGGALAGISNSASAAAGAIGAFVGQAAASVASLPGQIGGALAGVAAQLAGVGANMMAGLVRGIVGGASAVVSAIVNVASNAISAAKAALGIASPSKVFAREVGAWIPAGVAVGIDRNAYKVDAAVANLGNTTAFSADFGSRSGQVSAGNAAGNTVISLAGAVLTLMVDGNPIRAVVQEQLVLRSQAQNTASLMGVE